MTGRERSWRVFFEDFASGGVAAAVSKTVVAPVERVKLLLQLQDTVPDIARGGMKRYDGALDAFARVVSEQGVWSLWRGNTANVVRYFPTQAINFASKDAIKAAMPRFDPDTQFLKFFATNVLSGGLAGAVSLCVVYPLDLARTRLAADVGSGSQREFKGMGDLLWKVARRKGVGQLYYGFSTSLWGIVTYRALYFGLYDTAQRTVLTPDSSLGMKYLVAQVTTIVAGVIGYPFDTVRRRLMMQAGRPRDEIMYHGMLDAFAKIIKDEGFSAVYKGVATNIVRSAGGALVLVGYGELQKLLAAL